MVSKRTTDNGDFDVGVYSPTNQMCGCREFRKNVLSDLKQEKRYKRQGPRPLRWEDGAFRNGGSDSTPISHKPGEKESSECLCTKAGVASELKNLDQSR